MSVASCDQSEGPSTSIPMDLIERVLAALRVVPRHPQADAGGCESGVGNGGAAHGPTSLSTATSPIESSPITGAVFTWPAHESAGPILMTRVSLTPPDGDEIFGG